MPVEIEEMESNVSVVEGDLPLSDHQIEQLVQLVMARLERRQREQESFREATTVRRRSAPPLMIGE